MKHTLLLPLVCGAVLPLFAAATTVRAQTPGAQDTTFATGPNSNGPVRALALQPDGEVLVGGGFSTFRGEGRNCVARLNPTGHLEPFNPGLALSGYNGGSPSVLALGLQANGQIIAAGQFTVLNQTPGGGIARLNSDGTLDSAFNVGSGVADDGGVLGKAEAVVVLSSGQILVGGAFTSFNGTSRAGLVRLNANGSIDGTFDAGGKGITANAYGGDVKAIAIQPNGQIVIGGSFSAYDGASAGCVARLNADGTLDRTFSVGTGADVGVTALAVQAGSNQILAGGGFNDFDGVQTEHLVRLNTDGSLDTGYGFDPDGQVGLFIAGIDALLVQPDGTVLIGGDFLSDGGLVNSPTQGLYRLLADGTADTRFSGSNNVGEGVALALQADGKALVATNGDSSLVGATTGDALRVYDYVPAPTATVVRGMKKVYESGSKGPLTFIVSLSSAPTKKTVVKYVLKGAAVNGTDYVTPNFKAKFKPGVTTKTVSIYPIDRGIEDYSVVPVKLVLISGTGYLVGSPNLAKDKIVRNH